jgi:signal transduction histidine kinase
MLRVLLLIILLSISSIPLSAEQPRPLVWGIIPDYIPYSYIDENGTLTGFVYELISYILEELDIEYTLNLEPWSTMYFKLLSGEVDVYAPFVRLPERIALIYFPDTSIISAYTGIATTRKDSLNSFEALIGRTYVIIENDIPSETAFQQFMNSLLIPYALKRASTFDEAIRMLQQGEADGLVTDNRLILAREELYLGVISFNPRAGYWTSSIEAEEWVIEIVNVVADRIEELRKDPNSIYFELQDEYFQIREPLPRTVEILPPWLLILTASLLVSVIISIIIVQALTKKLRNNAFDLQKAVNAKSQELTSAYEQLIQSEKMITLGEAVAGMAHEVSTPLGVAYTAATLLAAVHERTPEEYLTVSKDALPVIVENLRRSGALIKTFKQITIDQTSGDLRAIILPDYVNQVWDSFSQKYAKQTIQFRSSVHNEHGEHIVVQLLTYPGAISRVLIHLLDNAMAHGHTPDRSDFTITCDHIIYMDDDDEVLNMQVTVEDNGVGYPIELQSKIMEPFFTTKTGSLHHSGLGLSAAYRTLEKTWNLKRWKIENREEGGVRVQFHIRTKTADEANIKILN